MTKSSIVQKHKEEVEMKRLRSQSKNSNGIYSHRSFINHKSSTQEYMNP